MPTLDGRGTPEPARKITRQEEDARLIRSARDEEILDLIRETVAQLNKLGDRLEAHVRGGTEEFDGSPE